MVASVALPMSARRHPRARPVCCAGLAPTSAATRAQKIRRRLGGQGRLDDCFPAKPKGMHRRTYKRLKDEAERFERAWGVGVAGKFRFPSPFARAPPLKGLPAGTTDGGLSHRTEKSGRATSSSPPTAIRAT